MATFSLTPAWTLRVSPLYPCPLHCFHPPPQFLLFPSELLILPLNNILCKGQEAVVKMVNLERANNIKAQTAPHRIPILQYTVHILLVIQCEYKQKMITYQYSCWRSGNKWKIWIWFFFSLDTHWPLAVRTTLNLQGTDTTWCWKHPSEILVHDGSAASYSYWTFVSCASMMPTSHCITS